MTVPPRPFDLARFRKAQQGHPGLQQALSELRAGAKVSHWIWYVFPQLAGLGTSPMAVRFALDGVQEAAAYLEDDDLSQGLAAAVDAAASQLSAGIPLPTLMGGEIDARKLVSSMTLFTPLAQARLARGAGPASRTVAAGGELILRAAAAAGYPPCAFTRERLSASGL